MEVFFIFEVVFIFRVVFVFWAIFIFGLSSFLELSSFLKFFYKLVIFHPTEIHCTKEFCQKFFGAITSSKIVDSRWQHTQTDIERSWIQDHSVALGIIRGENPSIQKIWSTLYPKSSDFTRLCCSCSWFICCTCFSVTFRDVQWRQEKNLCLVIHCFILQCLQDPRVVMSNFIKNESTLCKKILLNWRLLCHVLLYCQA